MISKNLIDAAFAEIQKKISEDDFSREINNYLIEKIKKDRTSTDTVDIKIPYVSATPISSTPWESDFCA